LPHNIDDLRDHLFATLTALRDKEAPMEVDRAKAVADVARVVIETAKVEVKAMELAGAGASSTFLPAVTPPVSSGGQPSNLRQIQRGLVK
jgi:hypothetical protein